MKNIIFPCPQNQRKDLKSSPKRVSLMVNSIILKSVLDFLVVGGRKKSRNKKGHQQRRIPQWEGGGRGVVVCTARHASGFACRQSEKNPESWCINSCSWFGQSRMRSCCECQSFITPVLPSKGRVSKGGSVCSPMRAQTQGSHDLPGGQCPLWASGPGLLGDMLVALSLGVLTSSISVESSVKSCRVLSVRFFLTVLWYSLVLVGRRYVSFVLYNN